MIVCCAAMYSRNKLLYFYKDCYLAQYIHSHPTDSGFPSNLHVGKYNDIHLDYQLDSDFDISCTADPDYDISCTLDSDFDISCTPDSDHDISGTPDSDYDI